MRLNELAYHKLGEGRRVVSDECMSAMSDHHPLSAHRRAHHWHTVLHSGVDLPLCVHEVRDAATITCATLTPAPHRRGATDILMVS